MRVLLILFIIFGVITLPACTNEEQIRKQLLEKTPIGAKFDEVMVFCSANNLKCNQSKTAGYLNQRTGTTVGVKSIWAVLSEHKNTPLSVSSISAYWGFDKDARLIDIWVWETIDAP